MLAAIGIATHQWIETTSTQMGTVSPPGIPGFAGVILVIFIPLCTTLPLYYLTFNDHQYRSRVAPYHIALMPQ